MLGSILDLNVASPDPRTLTADFLRDVPPASELGPELEPAPELAPEPEVPEPAPDRGPAAQPVPAPDRGQDELEAELERTGVTLEGGKVTISALAYADDAALTCDTKPEASRAVSAIRLGFWKDGDKEVS
jgi:hypothetical protein